MTYDLIIRNGTVVDGETTEKAKDIGVKSGKIIDVSDELDPSLASETIDATGKWVMPGLIDTHVHVVREDCTDEGFRMLLRAGVTTAVDFRGPIELLLNNFKQSQFRPNIALLNGVYPGNGFKELDVSYKEIENFVEYSLENGSIGIKVLGGHFPVTNETLGRAIEVSNKMKSYIAIHCGNTQNGSNIKGFLDAVKMAQGGRLHIAHVNSYCRGLVYNELEETKIALENLKANRNIISESYLSGINGTSGNIDKDNRPVSHVTRNCLKMKNYDISKKGLEKAILNGDCAVYYKTGDEMVLHYGQEAVDYWESVNYKANLCFDVNPVVPRIACATSKNDKGEFIVTALSTDGGAIPRNSLLDKGLLLVEFGALTISDFCLKTSLSPAQMLGLSTKGRIKKNFDADLVVVDKNSRKPIYTIIGGSIAAKGDKLMESKGKLLILEQGEKNIKRKGLDYQVIDLQTSLLYR
ncbi:MAG TPA: amidohydrolase family protein [Tissierellaceae bacterium]|nr:amidohydrolase family protein [Tissierellaceae bacterium]